MERTDMRYARGSEQGFVLIIVLAVILVLATLAALGLYLSGEDYKLSALRQRGSKSMYLAEGGAVRGRGALMAYMNADPVGPASLDASLTGANLVSWYAGGVPANQNPFRILDYITIDGQKFTIGATPATPSVTFQVNYGLAQPHLKLQIGGSPTDTLGGGTYHATVVLTPHPTAHVSCAGGPCAIHQTGPNAYEIFYTYSVTSDGQDPALPAKRRVIFTGNYSVVVQMQSFAMYLMYSDSDLGPGGEVAWANNFATYKGPVHTNGSFHFAFFPQYTDQITQTSPTALYWNNGSPVALPSTENVVGGVRIDAPLVPPFDDPQTARPASLTLGAPAIPMPGNAFSQEGVSIGRDPSDTSAVTTAQITAVIPELKLSASVPNGIYVPVVDAASNCRSDTNDPMAGGIYVKGDLDSLTMSVNGSKARYTLVQGATTTTVEVDRSGGGHTTVTSNGWLTPPSGGPCPGVAAGPATRTFNGVPKGWQGVGNANATMVYVDGAVNSIGGTLQKDEQTNVTAAGTITITDNILYQNPPNPDDPTSNPTNLLGLFSAGGDVQIGLAAPNDVQIQAMEMAGTSGSAFLSSVHVQNWSSRPPSGRVHLLGGTVGKYYGIHGVMDGSGNIIQGFGKDFRFDTRFRRGFAPPYFPTTGLFVINEGSQRLTTVRPVWREGTPP